MLTCSCGERLFVSHTYSPGQKAVVRNLKCHRCKKTYTEISMVVCEDSGRARSLSRRIEQGEDLRAILEELRS